MLLIIKNLLQPLVVQVVQSVVIHKCTSCASYINSVNVHTLMVFKPTPGASYINSVNVHLLMQDQRSW